MYTTLIIFCVILGFIANLTCALCATILYTDNTNKWVKRISIIPPFGIIAAIFVLLYAMGRAIWVIIKDIWD